MNRLNKNLEVVLDIICHQGCTYVRECIFNIQTNIEVIEVQSINSEEQQIILNELISIMEVYDMQKN